jgi:hypothetical protein
VRSGWPSSQLRKSDAPPPASSSRPAASSLVRDLDRRRIPVRRVYRQIFSSALWMSLSCAYPKTLLTSQSNSYCHSEDSQFPSTLSPTARGDLTSLRQRIPVVAHPPESAANCFGLLLRNSLGLLLVLTSTLPSSAHYSPDYAASAPPSLKRSSSETR